MTISSTRIDRRPTQTLQIAGTAPGVTEQDAKHRLEQARFLVERFDDASREERYETVLLLPATNRTKEHCLRGVTTYRNGTVASTVELLTSGHGWALFDELPAARAESLAGEVTGQSSRTRKAVLQETQSQQLLQASLVLS